MANRILVAALLCLSSAAVHAQHVVREEPSLIVASVVRQVREPADHIPHTVVAEIRAHVVQVKVYGAGGAIHSGSGTYLGDRIVLTAAHVVEGAHRARVNFPNPDNDQGPFLDSLVGNVRATDATWDQAVIELESLPRHNPPGSPLAADNPTTGDKVNFAGYPGGKQLRVMRGEFQNYATARGQATADWFDADAGVVSGYSGGAAYNDRGELYGNLWGSTGHCTVAVCLGRTKRFLFPWNARLEAWRLAVMTGNARPMQYGYCPPNYCPPQQQPQRQPRYIEPGDEGVPPPGRPGGGNEGGSLIPVQPPTKAPTQPPVDIKAIESAIANINNTIAGMESRIDSLSSKHADAAQTPHELSEGDVGKIVDRLLISMEGNPAFRGPPGDTGPKGEDGKPATLDMDALTASVIAKLPPVKMEIHNQGRVSRTQAPLGKPIAIGQKDRTKK